MTFDEGAVNRAKTTEESTPGSFAPKGFSSQFPLDEEDEAAWSDEQRWKFNYNMCKVFLKKNKVSVIEGERGVFNRVSPFILRDSLAELDDCLHLYPSTGLKRVVISRLVGRTTWGIANSDQGVISLNTSIFIPDRFTILAERDFTGWHDGVTDPASVIRHEFGHFLDNSLRGSNRGDQHQAWLIDRGFVSGDRAPRAFEPAVSKYAMTNQHEWFAETFTAARYGDAKAKKHKDVAELMGYLQGITSASSKKARRGKKS